MNEGMGLDILCVMLSTIFYMARFQLWDNTT